MQIQSKYDIVIIGGGVYGLSIAYYLSKNQDIKIALLQQYAIGHNKGSSHSTTRITRSLYEKEVYRDLNNQCLEKNWKEMEKVLQQKFIVSNQFIYFQDNEESYQDFRKVAEQSPAQSVKICADFQQYSKYYKSMKHPQIHSKFPPIIDKKAGIIMASSYIKKVKEFLQKSQNVAVMEHTFVKSINENKKQVGIETQSEILRANKVIVAGGKWIKELIPQVSDLFEEVKQHMAFLELQPQFSFSVGKYPAFAYHQKSGKLFYSLPGDTSQKLGVKLSQHRNSISQLEEQNSFDSNYQQLRKKALEYFGQDFIRVKNVEECIYTVTRSKDFVIDWVGQSNKILVCSCCSGHGFKFAPVIAQVISSLVDDSGQTKPVQKEQNQVFKKWAHMFKIPYHRGVNLE